MEKVAVVFQQALVDHTYTIPENALQSSQLQKSEKFSCVRENVIEDTSLKHPETDNMTRTVKMETRNHKPWSYHKCILCPYKTMSHSIIKKHSKRHRVTRNPKIFNCMGIALKRYKCQSHGCNYKSQYLVSFNNHVQSTHKTIQTKNVLDPSSEMNSQKNYNCQHCSFETCSQLFLFKHYSNCPVIKFLNKKRQNRSVTNTNGINKDDETVVKCPYCPYHSKFRYYITKHLKVHCRNDGNDWHHCRNCTFKTRSPQIMHRHLMGYVDPVQIRTGKKSNSCVRKTQKVSDRVDLTNLEENPNKLKTHSRDRVTFEHSYCREVSTADLGQTPQEICDSSPDRQVSIEDNDQTKNKSENVRLESPVKDRTMQILSDTETESLFKCSKCSFVSNHQTGYNHHLAFRHSHDKDIKWLECPQCPYKTIFTQRLESHTRVSHKSTSPSNLEKYVSKQPEDVSRNDNVPWYHCDFGDFKSKDYDSVNEHILMKHVVSQTVVRFKCDLCKYETLDEKEIKAHILEKHVCSHFRVSCEICREKFKTDAELKAHVMLQHIL